MEHDVQYLNSANLIVTLNHMVKTVFPVQHRHQITVLIHRKESSVPVNYLFKPRRLHIFNNSPEAVCNILRYGSFLVPPFVFVDSITNFILAVHFPHPLLSDYFPCYAAIHHHRCQFKAEWGLYEAHHHLALLGTLTTRLIPRIVLSSTDFPFSYLKHRIIYSYCLFMDNCLYHVMNKYLMTNLIFPKYKLIVGDL